LWSKLRLKLEPQREIEIAREGFEIIGSAVHTPDQARMRTDDWIFEQRVMPHIKVVTKHIREYPALSNIQDGSSSVGNVYRRHGRYNEALEWCV